MRKENQEAYCVIIYRQTRRNSGERQMQQLKVWSKQGTNAFLCMCSYLE